MKIMIHLVRKYMNVNEHKRLKNRTLTAGLHFTVTIVSSTMSKINTLK